MAKNFLETKIYFVLKYISAWHKYNEAISYLLTQPKYRLKAVEIARERGLLRDSKQLKGKKKRDKVCLFFPLMALNQTQRNFPLG